MTSSLIPYPAPFVILKNSSLPYYTPTHPITFFHPPKNPSITPLVPSCLKFFPPLKNHPYNRTLTTKLERTLPPKNTKMYGLNGASGDTPNTEKQYLWFIVSNIQEICLSYIYIQKTYLKICPYIHNPIKPTELSKKIRGGYILYIEKTHFPSK